MLVQAVPLYTCISPFVPQLMHHSINPAVGLGIASRCAPVIFGGKNPLVVLLTSNCADVAGVEVPIPTLPPFGLSDRGQLDDE